MCICLCWYTETNRMIRNGEEKEQLNGREFIPHLIHQKQMQNPKKNYSRVELILNHSIVQPYRLKEDIRSTDSSILINARSPVTDGAVLNPAVITEQSRWSPDRMKVQHIVIRDDFIHIFGQLIFCCSVLFLLRFNCVHSWLHPLEIVYQLPIIL